MKYLKRIWFSTLAIPAMLIFTIVSVIPDILRGEVDEYGWNPFNEK